MKLLDCIAGLVVNPMACVLLIALLVAAWVLWKVQTSPKHIDLVDLLVDTDGRASWTKITAIGAFMMSSWAFAYLTMHDKMSDFLFLSYVAVYSGAPVAYRIIAAKSPTPPPAAPVGGQT
jgi:hypothetical protein